MSVWQPNNIIPATYDPTSGTVSVPWNTTKINSFDRTFTATFVLSGVDNNIQMSGSLNPQPQDGPVSFSGSLQTRLSKINFDLNQTTELCQLVSFKKNTPNIASVLTSNASTWEPGEFNNGVTSFGPRNNVFILHNSGSAQGASQRYMYLGLATHIPLILSQIQVSVSSNAQGHSATSPVNIAVDTSSREDFFDSAVLGSSRLL